MVTYTAKVLERIPDRPDAWNTLKVGVFRVDGEKEGQIGEYARNYGSLFRTFFHCKYNDKDYALYSPDYTVTRVMELPSCKDIGGEEPHSFGFCPVDYNVPCYIDREYITLEDKVRRYRVNDPSPDNLALSTTKYTPLDEKTGERIVIEKPDYPVSPVLYYPFGFVAGCIWGDDSSWKIQYLDLSEIEKGVIKREERFGYIAMPDELTLKQAISMADYQYDPDGEDAHSITIAIQRRFDLRTGKAIDVDPFG
jgi:hypothetical protein